MLRTIAFFLMISAPAAVLASGEGTGAPVPETAVLIVDRRPETVSLFLSLPASDLKPVFGTGAEALLGADGTIDIDRLNEGTYDLADRIFAPVRTEIGGRPVTFDAISMMVHDPEVLPAFETPWEGETSITICTSPETVDRMGLETLQAYLGFYAWKVSALAPLSVTFPDTAGPVEIEIREFWNMQHTGTRYEIIGDGRTLVLEPGQGSRLGAATLWILALALLGVGAVFLTLHMRRGTPDRAA